MAQARLSMRKIREILRLRYEAQLSRRQIARSLGCSRKAVAECLQRAAAAGLTWPLPSELEEAALEVRLYPPAVPCLGTPLPDLAVLHAELHRPGVTRMLLWQEYRESHPEGYGYTWFCGQYRLYVRRARPTFTHRHQAGAVMQTDYAGQTAQIIDPSTGEIGTAQIFVAVLGASSLTYARASFSQRLSDWIEGQSRALAYFGGVPKSIVCDFVPGNKIAVMCPAPLRGPSSLCP